MAPNPKYDPSCKPLPEPAKPLSVSERRLLWAIRKFFETNRYAPSVSELAAIAKAPVQTCYDQAHRLSAKGYIERANNPRHSIIGLTPKGTAVALRFEKQIGGNR